MRLRVVAYATGSKAIGTGHLTRQIDLLNAFIKQTNTTGVLVTHKSKGLMPVTARARCRVRYLAANQQSARSVLAEIKKLRPDIILVDHLTRRENRHFTDALKRITRCLVIFSDSPKPRVPPCDFFVNTNPCLRLRSSARHHPSMLLGPKYFVLPPEVMRLRTHLRPIRKNPKRLFISLGGSDHKNLILNIIPVVAGLPKDMVIKIVVGSCSGLYHAAQKLLAKSRGPRIRLYPFLSNFSRAVAGADVVISAGGNTLFQRAALGTPGITICQLKQQDEVANAFAKHGANRNLGLGTKLKPARLRQALSSLMARPKLRRMQRTNGMKLVGGTGASVIVERVVGFLCDPGGEQIP